MCDIYQTIHNFFPDLVLVRIRTAKVNQLAKDELFNQMRRECTVSDQEVIDETNSVDGRFMSGLRVDKDSLDGIEDAGVEEGVYIGWVIGVVGNIDQ